MPFTNSPNMGLPLPGIQTEPGPQFASDINQALSILDGHTHGPMSGVPIGSQSINLQSDLSFNVNNAAALRSVRFISTTATSGTDVGCVYVKGVDLFYNDLNANVVRITTNGGLASTSLTQGLINTTAIISANAPQIPATSGFIRMNNNGDFVSWRNAANSADDKIFFDSSDNLQIIGSPAGGIQTYGVRLLDQIGGKVVYFDAVSNSSAYTLAVPNNPPQTTNLLLMNKTGAVASNFAIVSGEITNCATSGNIYGANVGVTNTGTGQCTISFTPPFSSTPNIVGSGETTGIYVIVTPIQSTSAAVLVKVVSSDSLTNGSFQFIAFGPRN